MSLSIVLKPLKGKINHLNILSEKENILVTSMFFFSQKISGTLTYNHLAFRLLAHLSTTCSGGAIVTGHRPSVRPSVCPSVRPSICPSVNNFFKNLLLQNQKANLDKTWQECSLGEALQKLLKEFNSNKNSGCHGNKMAENGKNL